MKRFFFFIKLRRVKLSIRTWLIDMQMIQWLNGQYKYISFWGNDYIFFSLINHYVFNRYIIPMKCLSREKEECNDIKFPPLIPFFQIPCPITIVAIFVETRHLNTRKNGIKGRKQSISLSEWEGTNPPHPPARSVGVRQSTSVGFTGA